jgi:S-adenosylmethionine synthetase
LKNPIYRATAAYGHFGRQPVMQRVDGRDVKLFAWEEPNKVGDLRKAAKL